MGIEESFVSHKDRLLPEVGVALVFHLELPDVSEVHYIFLLYFSIGVFIDPKIILVVDVDDGFLERTIGSVQLAPEAFLEDLIILKLLSLLLILKEMHGRPAVDEEEDGSAKIREVVFPR